LESIDAVHATNRTLASHERLLLLLVVFSIKRILPDILVVLIPLRGVIIVVRLVSLRLKVVSVGASQQSLLVFVWAAQQRLLVLIWVT
jgi:hypothetical protein